jgi:hypothetical protein
MLRIILGGRRRPQMRIQQKTIYGKYLDLRGEVAAKNILSPN